MKNLIILVVILCLMAVANFALADTIQGINVDFVNIGHAGNTADTGGTPGCGAVGYNYRIGKYEVTNTQWNAFTAAAGVPTGNPSQAYDNSAYFTGAQQPTNMVSWYEAAQFCNYLTSGNKALGAYQLGTDGSITISRASAISAYGTVYVIPTENEWYKATYFKPDSSGYSLYANGTNTTPIPGVESNYNYTSSAPWDVGTGMQEQNGTFDMMGNAWEWNETLIDAYRGTRGGSFYVSPASHLESSYQLPYLPYNEDYNFGFRVAEIPEPATIILLSLGGITLRLGSTSLTTGRSRQVLRKKRI